MSNRASYQKIDNIRIGHPSRRVATSQEQADIKSAINRLTVAIQATNETELRYQLSNAFRLVRRLNQARNPSN